MVANSLLIAGAAVLIADDRPWAWLLRFIAGGGLALNIAWLGVTWRGWEMSTYWLNEAAAVEGRAFDEIKVVRRFIETFRPDEVESNGPAKWVWYQVRRTRTAAFTMIVAMLVVDAAVLGSTFA